MAAAAPTMGTATHTPHAFRSRLLAAALLMAALSCASAAHAQTAPEPFTPTSGMPGKDAVWVPTSPELTEAMLDLAGVTSDDLVVDLGSGDGRMVIAAARRGARAIGVEYNPDLVTLSEEAARREGVSDRVTFVQGDMFTADISQATVLALFMLSEHLRRLTPRFLDLAPGTRIVVNSFGIPDWEPDRVEHLEDVCPLGCEAKLYVVPARVAGTWTFPGGSLVAEQTFQQISGTLRRGDQTLSVEGGVVDGTRVRFTAGGDQYEGRVEDRHIDWTVSSGGDAQRFRATRQQ